MNQLPQDKWASVTLADLTAITPDQLEGMPREERGWNSPHAPIACAVDDLLWESMIFHLHRTSLLEGCKESNFMLCPYFTILLHFLLACISGRNVNLFNSSPSLCWFPTFILYFLSGGKRGPGELTNIPQQDPEGLYAPTAASHRRRVLNHPPLLSWGL